MSPAQWSAFGVVWVALLALAIAYGDRAWLAIRDAAPHTGARLARRIRWRLGIASPSALDEHVIERDGRARRVVPIHRYAITVETSRRLRDDLPALESFVRHRVFNRLHDGAWWDARELASDVVIEYHDATPAAYMRNVVEIYAHTTAVDVPHAWILRPWRHGRRAIARRLERLAHRITPTPPTPPREEDDEP